MAKKAKRKGIVQIFEDFVDSILRKVHTTLPGQIETYNEDDKIAKVKILVRLRMVDGEILSIPPIENVPVIFPIVKGFSLEFPLEKGDGVEVRFCEEGLGAFLKGKTEVDGDSFARFALTDAICTPGLWSPKSRPAKPKATIKIDKDGNINFNGDSKNLVTHEELNGALQTFITALNLHIHSGVTTGPGVSGPPGTPLNIDISNSKADTLRTDG